MPKILFITTSQAQMGNSEQATGLWLEELTTPYYTFVDAGASVTIASIKGGAVPVDPSSQNAAGKNSPSVERFLKDSEACLAIEQTVALDQVNASEYDAIFLPGGHGTMWDLPKSQVLADMIAQTLAANHVVAAVCHGPAGLVQAITAEGLPIVQGRKISAFTNSEEEAAGLTAAVPFLLETKLRELGAEFHQAPDFQAFAIADGNLITGQNPASSALVASKVLAALGVS
jgi:putative intracellular protease/amidase